MGMTIAEKILARKSGLPSVSPGQIVDAYPDLVMSHTATWRSVSVMEKAGAKKLYDPDRIAIVLDNVQSPFNVGAIIRVVADRCPVSVAHGELLEEGAFQDHSGLSYVKWGLAGCAGQADWQDRLRVAGSSIQHGRLRCIWELESARCWSCGGAEG